MLDASEFFKKLKCYEKYRITPIVIVAGETYVSFQLLTKLRGR